MYGRSSRLLHGREREVMAINNCEFAKMKQCEHLDDLERQLTVVNADLADCKCLLAGALRIANRAQEGSCVDCKELAEAKEEAAEFSRELNVSGGHVFDLKRELVDANAAILKLSKELILIGETIGAKPHGSYYEQVKKFKDEANVSIETNENIRLKKELAISERNRLVNLGIAQREEERADKAEREVVVIRKQLDDLFNACVHNDNPAVNKALDSIAGARAELAEKGEDDVKG